MMDVSCNRKEVEIGGKTASLRAEIKKTVVKDEIVIVLLDPDGETSGNTNVVGFDRTADRRWEIESAPVDRDEKPYVDIREEGDDVVVDNWVGVRASVNLDDGALGDESLTK